MSLSNQAEFGKIRAFLWPIYRNEMKKIIPMLLMIFLICFNYTILKNLKDSVVITAQSSGVEVIPFIKVWALLPMAILATYIFTKLSNRFSQERVFYLTITFFLVVFAIFAFLVYPYKNIIHPHEVADYLESIMPAGFKGLISMFRNWSFTVFYVFCELWSTMVLTVLFWGFANEVTKIVEARRFYGMMAVVGSFASTAAGVGANYLTINKNWDDSLQTLVSVVVLFGLATMVIFWWMNKNVLSDPSFKDLHETRVGVKKKQKISLREGFRFLSNSKYLVCIAVVVVCYNLVINMVEIVWKDQLYQLYPSGKEYNDYQNDMTSIVGLFATVISLFMSPLISRYGWTKTALITPIIMLVTSIGFFTFMLFRNDLHEPVYLLFGTTPLVIAVFFGAAQVCLSKACKFSIFDSTKEMAFIPLAHETKLKGKAAIDGVGSRLGKSGSSLIYQVLFMVFSTIGASAPYVALIIMVVIVGWIIAVKSLGLQFTSLVDDDGREEIGEKKESAVIGINPSDTPSNGLQPTLGL
ncbi:MAG: Npt1/Npt2 family nucleotide transporter [Parachlamydiaceae bacterium]|nr:Npt1/Npt2 family nucleotide transporter [Parachlamydiaceae bacterium]